MDLDHKCIERLMKLFLNNWHLTDLSPTSARLIDLQQVLFPIYSHQANQAKLGSTLEIKLREPVTILRKLELQYQ